MDERLYEERRNANLPFGYWLVVDDEEPPHLIDEQGQRWKSLRDYIWRGRLGMATNNPVQCENQIEFLLSILAAMDQRTVPIEEHVTDFFVGSWDVARHYGSWLEGHGLIEDGLSGALTPEGQAILVALASTRSAGAAPIPIGLATIEPNRGPDSGEIRDDFEQMIAANERFAHGLPHRFVRDTIAETPAIKLIGLPDGENVPLGRVVWSITCSDTHARDRLYSWLLHRIDRWETWADLAYKRGARTLSEHLLQMK